MDARKIAEKLVDATDKYLSAAYVKRVDMHPEVAYNAHEDLVRAFEKMLSSIEAQIKREIENISEAVEQ
jgi:polyhydroxyalkanoate synthesis regulator phasin